MNLFENLQTLHESQSTIELFINTPIEELVDGKLITDVFNEYSNDYKQLPKGMDATSPKYDDVKKQFYIKYYDVAKKCKEIDKSTKFNPSGYGRSDYFILRARDKCRKIDYTFPYGWK
jgi:hypothetical protein